MELTDREIYIILLAHWQGNGRINAYGQAVLIALRNRVAGQEGRAIQDIQDECCAEALSRYGGF